MMSVSGCKDLNATLPAGTSNPAVFNTPAGALMKRNVALVTFNDAFFQYIVDAGLISDELEDPRTGTSLLLSGSPVGSLDERILPQLVGSDENARGSLSYADLQIVRARANDALGALAKYDPAASPALRGEMYAVQGYAEVMLAELFCSGVPLSTFDFEGDFTYHPGSTQQETYQDAIAKFDSAIALSSDSARILNMARVGLGRAYLDLGDYANASAAVASVPDGFRYQVSLKWGSTPPSNNLNTVATLSDSEGVNGIPFSTSGDPRSKDTAATPFGATSLGVQLYFPKKYRAGLQSPYYGQTTVADGIEARLIQAEVALQTGDPSWLTILNVLRTTSTTCTVQTTPSCAASAPAGIGGVAGLPLLVDPGSSAGDTARINLLFSERAYWFYLTGHRQGDLRRLVRNYHRDQSTVYPTGLYLAPGQRVYGIDVTAPIPTSETPNPYFHGCLDRKA
jgi:hypothetical protein